MTTSRKPSQFVVQARPSMGASSQLWCQQSSTHSNTLPCISYKPNALGSKLPTGDVFLPLHLLPESRPLARLTPISSPQLYAVLLLFFLRRANRTSGHISYSE